MPHQQLALDRLDTHKRILLDFRPGSGKSLIAIEAIERFGPEDSLLTMASGGLPVFDQQADEWAFRGSPWTVPYSMLTKWVSPTGGAREALREGKGRLPLTVADECHRLKGRKTAWTAAFEKMADRSERLLLMTGTPMPVGSVDLYMFLKFLFPGDRRFTSYWRWVAQWYEMTLNRHSGMMTEIGRLIRSPEEFAAQFEDRWLHASVDEQLPEFSHQVVECEMTPKQRKVYKELKTLLMTTVGSTEVVYFQPGTQWAKMIQVTTGLETIDPSVRSSSKLDTLESILSDRAGQRTVVFCLYRPSAEAVLSRFPGSLALHGGMSKSARAEAAAAFNRGDSPVLVCTYAAAAEGWNLQTADCLVRVESAVRAGDLEQAWRRIYRKGQQRPCLLIDLVCPDSVDSRLRRQLADAKSQTDEVAAALALL